MCWLRGWLCTELPTNNTECLLSSRWRTPGSICWASYLFRLILIAYRWCLCLALWYTIYLPRINNSLLELKDAYTNKYTLKIHIERTLSIVTILAVNFPWSGDLTLIPVAGVSTVGTCMYVTAPCSMRVTSFCSMMTMSAGQAEVTRIDSGVVPWAWAVWSSPSW
jgi:hypothetical protein